MKKQVLLLCALALFFAVGCGEDKGSTAAKRLELSKNLDSGNYQAVLNDPNASATDYAAAAMGAVGIDPVNLVKKVNEMSTTGSSNNLSAVTSISITPDNLQYLELAGEKLSSVATTAAPAFQSAAPAAQASTLTGTALTASQEIYFQRTLVDVVYVVVALAQVGQNNALDQNGGLIIAGDGTSGQFYAGNGISEAEATNLGQFIADKATSSTLDTLTVHTMCKDTTTGVYTACDKTLVDAIANRVLEVYSFIYPSDLLGVGITSDIYTTLTGVTSGQKSLDYNGDGTVTGTDLSDYLYCVIGNQTGGSTNPGTGRTCL